MVSSANRPAARHHSSPLHHPRHRSFKDASDCEAFYLYKNYFIVIISLYLLFKVNKQKTEIL